MNYLNQFRRLALAAAAFFLGLVVWAETPALPPTLRVMLVTIAPDGASQAIVSPTDGEGRALRGLAAANFQVTVNGRGVGPVTVAPAQAVQVPLSVVLGIDISGSMRGAKIDGAIKGASAFLDRLGKKDMVALITFGTDVHVLSDFTDDHERIKQVLAGLKAPDKQTHLYQAIFDSLDRVSKAPTTRGAVVLLTDGKDEGSPIGPEEVLAKITASEVPVYMLGYGGDADTKTLKRFSAASHGEFYMAPAGSDLSGAYRDIADQLQNDYQLTWTTPRQSAPSAQATIVLQYRGQNVSVTQPAILTGAAAPVAAIKPKSPIPWWPWLAGLIVLLLAAFAFLLKTGRIGRGAPSGAEQTMVLPSVWLEVVKGVDMGTRSIVFGKQAVIGRDPKLAQIVIKHDPMTGREHARLRLNPVGNWVIEDMKSQNGTTVNGITISEPVTLQADDRIGVGMTELVFIEKRRGA